MVGSELVEISITGLLSCHTATVRFPYWYVLLMPLIKSLLDKWLQLGMETFVIASEGSTAVQPSSH